MKKDTMPIVARFWNDIAQDFDTIYTGKKNPISRAMDKWLRADIYQRFDWVMERSGDVNGLKICDVGCGSGRFVTDFVKRGASHVTGVDVAPEMLKLAKQLCTDDGTMDRCSFYHADAIDWTPDQIYDLTIAIGFWDYIMDPPGRLKKMREFTNGKFLTAWPRYWTWRMPVRKVRLEYIQGCPVYFFKRDEAIRMVESAGFKVDRCDTVGQLFCIEAHSV